MVVNACRHQRCPTGNNQQNCFVVLQIVKRKRLQPGLTCLIRSVLVAVLPDDIASCLKSCTSERNQIRLMRHDTMEFQLSACSSTYTASLEIVSRNPIMSLNGFFSNGDLNPTWYPDTCSNLNFFTPLKASLNFIYFINVNQSS